MRIEIEELKMQVAARSGPDPLKREWQNLFSNVCRGKDQLAIRLLSKSPTNRAAVEEIAEFQQGLMLQILEHRAPFRAEMVRTWREKRAREGQCKRRVREVNRRRRSEEEEEEVVPNLDDL